VFSLPFVGVHVTRTSLALVLAKGSVENANALVRSACATGAAHPLLKKKKEVGVKKCTEKKRKTRKKKTEHGGASKEETSQNGRVQLAVKFAQRWLTPEKGEDRKQRGTESRQRWRPSTQIIPRWV
jgi:hypothetical protein